MGDWVSAEVLARLDQGGLILTGNDRTARAVRLAWHRLQIRRGHRSWQPANVLSWRSWTLLLWKAVLLDGRTAALLLSPLQEAVIWRRVIQARTSADSLLSTTSLADLAAATWQRLCAYEGRQRLESIVARLHGDSLEFALWARSFRNICTRESLLSESLLEAELRHHLAKGDLSRWDKGILLLGFDQTTPAQNSLMQACRVLGVAMEFAEVPSPGIGLLVATSDEKEELRGCARWIREKLLETPDARIALIVNDLEREMSAIDSVLREVLSPELENIAVESSQVSYEFSLGRPLSHEPMVKCAFDLLRWAAEPLPLANVSRLLLSPYFGGATHEVAARAEFDHTKLRRHLRLRPQITIDSFLRELRGFPLIQARLSSFHRIVEDVRYAQSRSDLRSRGFGAWTDWMRGWLSRAHWGETDVAYSSREYQVRARWERALDDFATLDFLGEEVDFAHALATLDRLISDIIFAPQSRDAPVQVLGPLEAAGEHFDAVWVLRAGELSWPPASASLALLPRSFQKDLGMPGTDEERERETARTITRRLAGSGTNVVFSHAQSSVDGGHQRAAAVVRELQLQAAVLADITASELPRLPLELERVDDEGRVSALPTPTHRGGVRVLELQAACGFRAFAEMRLGSSDPRERDVGLNPIERGNIVHAALECFWTTVGSQQNLRAMEPDERTETVHRAVSHSLATVQQRTTDLWDRAYLEVQHVRLTRLLNDWLSAELQRPDFVVIEQETRQSVSIGPLQLSLRVDRVDLVDGRHVILDYKTGEASTSEWLSDRPDKPQVPLYAILSQETAGTATSPSSPLGAVGFALVRAGSDLKLRGFEAAPGILYSPGSRTKPAKMEAETFEAQIARWREILEQLANDFVKGDTRVRPKRFPTTCERCSQRVLCRADASLFEASLLDKFEYGDERTDG